MKNGKDFFISKSLDENTLYFISENCQIFKIKKSVYFNKYLELRNNQEVRNLFCEVIMGTKTRKPKNLPRI